MLHFVHITLLAAYLILKKSQQVKQKKREELSLILHNVKIWEKSAKTLFPSVPTLEKILAGYNRRLEQQGDTPLTPETISSIKSSYSILIQHQNWDEELTKNPLALFHASINHALYLQDITLSENQLEQVNKAQEAFKLLRSMSDSTKRDMRRVCQAISQSNKEDGLTETSLDTMLKALDLLSSLRNSPKEMPENSENSENLANLNSASPAATEITPEISKSNSAEKSEQTTTTPSTPPTSSTTSTSLSTPSTSSATSLSTPPTSSSPSSSSSSPSSSPSSTPSTPSSTSTSSAPPPKMPWLTNIDVDSLGTPKNSAYFMGMWYRLAFSQFSTFRDFMPSRLLAGAKTAIQAFADNLNEGNIDNLKEMLSPPLYKYYYNLLQSYKEKNIKLVLNMKPIDEGFIHTFLILQYINAKDHDQLASLVPGEGPTLEEIQAMAIRRGLSGIGYAFWQEPDDGSIEDGYDPAAVATRGEVMRAQISATFSVYVNCKEVYYLEDSSGTLIEGSKTTTEHGHVFTFFTPMNEVSWKIVDMNNFNQDIGEEIPLFQIAPDEHYLVLRNYKKM